MARRELKYATSGEDAEPSSSLSKELLIGGENVLCSNETINNSEMIELAFLECRL